jgi:D-glycero-alpha-D-manno-heptose-7-phosphate kinase
MMIISRTPLRISFFGGGSDYSAYTRRHRGAVLGTTINKYVYISINTLSDFFEHKIRIGYSKTELVKTLDEIEHPSIRECLKYKQLFSNLDIHIFADFPARTGLASSSAFTTGFLNALDSLQGKKISKQKLAEEACHVEQNLIRELVGSQDQFHAAFGGFNLIEFKENQTLVRPLLITREKKQALEDHLMVFYTGLTRFANEVIKEQIEKTALLFNDRYLHRMVEMVFEAEELVVSTSVDLLPQRFGRLLHESWELKKNLSSQISNSSIDKAYQKALDAGAYGGKLCGAGSGGVLALFAPPQKKAAIREQLAGYLEVPVHFENEGSSIIYRYD